MRRILLPCGAGEVDRSEATWPERASPTPAFYVAARGHHADVGGIAPGSMPPFSRTLEEEGVLLDALPVMRSGSPARGRGAGRLLAPGRTPRARRSRNLADLKAQIAACEAGAHTVARHDRGEHGAKHRRRLHALRPGQRGGRRAPRRLPAARRRRRSSGSTAAARSTSRSGSMRRRGEADHRLHRHERARWTATLTPRPRWPRRRCSTCSAPWWTTTSR